MKCFYGVVVEWLVVGSWAFLLINDYLVDFNTV